MDFEKEINLIKERNTLVELDKQWETSFTRRLFISLLTYIIALAWLWAIKDTNPWLKAIVPVAGFILSTLSLPIIKKWWIKK